jgi:hypothetical protein
MGENRTAYGSLVGEPEGKRPLGRPRHKWMGNVKIDLIDIDVVRYGGLDSSGLK